MRRPRRASATGGGPPRTASPPPPAPAAPAPARGAPPWGSVARLLLCSQEVRRLKGGSCGRGAACTCACTPSRRRQPCGPLGRRRAHRRPRVLARVSAHEQQRRRWATLRLRLGRPARATGLPCVDSGGLMGVGAPPTPHRWPTRRGTPPQPCPAASTATRPWGWCGGEMRVGRAPGTWRASTPRSRAMPHLAADCRLQPALQKARMAGRGGCGI